MHFFFLSFLEGQGTRDPNSKKRPQQKGPPTNRKVEWGYGPTLHLILSIALIYIEDRVTQEKCKWRK